MKKMKYQNLRRHLQSRITRWKPPEFHVPEMEEDPDWPTPTDTDAIDTTVERLPAEHRVIIALIAAEMVLPIWEEWAARDDEVDADALRQAVELTWAWIRGNVLLYRLEEAAVDAYEVTYAYTDGTYPYDAAYAAYAAVTSSYNYTYADDSYAVTNAVESAALAAQGSGWWPSREAFFRDWWAKCRARLAFKDVAATRVSGRTTGTREQYKEIRAAFEPREQRFGLLEAPLLPEDPDWPTPAAFGAPFLAELLGRLPHKQRVICALTSAEMVLPIWEEWSEGHDDVDVGAPSQAIKVAWAWISGDASVDEAYSAGDDAYAAFAFASAYSAATAAATAANAAEAAAYAAFAPANPILATVAVAIAATAGHGSWRGSGWWPSREAFYRDWWARCRARLAFKDVETVEVSGSRTTGTREQYERIHASLEEPQEQRFDSVAFPLLPEDPDWPTPVDYDSVLVLMERLSPQAALVCALTAAEMVLPIWDAQYREDHRPEDAIVMAWRWLAGDGDRNELHAARDSAYAAYISVPAGDFTSAYYAANAVTHAVDADQVQYGFFAARAVYYAAAATSVGSGGWGSVDVEAADQRFYRRWWSACRRRLAIYDVSTAEMEWKWKETLSEQAFATLKDATEYLEGLGFDVDGEWDSMDEELGTYYVPVYDRSGEYVGQIEVTMEDGSAVIEPN